MFMNRKIKKLLGVCNALPYVAYYSHEGCDCFKIDNPFTEYRTDTIVLCAVKEGFEKALTLAIIAMDEAKRVFGYQTDGR